MKCLTDAQMQALQKLGRVVDTPAQMEAAARDLVAIAAHLGLVLTVEQRPLVPLAMGHHETTVSVRPARGRSLT